MSVHIHDFSVSMASSHLFLRWRSELFGLLCSNGSRHVEGQHQLVVAELLVELQLGDKVVREGHDGLNAVLQLAVAEIVKQLAHLGDGGRNKRQILLHHCCMFRHICYKQVC